MSLRLLLFIVVLILSSAVDIWAGWALDHVAFTSSERLAVALAPLPGDILVIAMVIARIRALDEFQKRVHFEAVVVAFLTTGVAIFIYGYLRQAEAVGPLNALWVWALMLVTYGAGYALTVRRYQ